MKHGILTAAVALATAAPFALAPAEAAPTVLTFDGNICGPAGNQVCTDGAEIGQGYGDGTGVNVSYRALTAGGGTEQPQLNFWQGGYGDLVRVIYGNTSFASEITFAALAGYEVALIGFDAACYLDRASCRAIPYSVSELGGSAVASGTASPPIGASAAVTLNTAYSTSGFTLRWGPDSFNGGLDNIAFDVRAVTAAPGVPEPATWAMMIVGFGAVGATLRRRHETKAAALA